MFDQPDVEWEHGAAPLLGRLFFAIQPAPDHYVTLNVVGDFRGLPYNELDAAMSAASTVELPSFAPEPDRLRGLQRSLALALERHGLGRGEAPIAPASGTARELVLVHSLPGRHCVLARWTLS